MKSSKDKYLVTKNVVEIRNGLFYMVVGDILLRVNGFLYTDDYGDDLTFSDDEFDIVKVYKLDGFGFGFNGMNNINNLTLLWERNPKITFTPDEIVILKNIDKYYKYIARDGNGWIGVYERIPSKREDYYTTMDSVKNTSLDLNSFKHLFKNITFESGVHLIADLIKENEK